MPLVSVVLPFFNRDKSLLESINSVLEQDFTDLELILVNDGSTDRSLDVALDVRDPRVRVVSSATNCGASAARNRGISVAASRYLAFQDSDDIWLPKKLSRQLGWLREKSHGSPPLAAVGSMWQIRLKNQTVVTRAPKIYATARDILADCVPTGIGTPTLVLDRERVDPNVRFDLSLSCFEERDYLFRSLRSDSTFGIVDEPLVEVRRGRTGHQATPTKAARGYEALLEKHAQVIQQIPQAEQWLHYRAMREWLAARRFGPAIRHLSACSPLEGCWQTFALGGVAGQKGLALAGRLSVPHNPNCHSPDLYPTLRS